MDYFHSTGMEELDQSSLHPISNKAPLDGRGSIPPAYVAWRAGTKIIPARQAWNRFLGSCKGLQIRTQVASASQRATPPNT
jgi:hypothetical protein